MRSTNRLLALGLVMVLSACGNEDGALPLAESAPEAATLAVTVASPFADDGAVSFELSGPEFTNVRGAHGVEAFVTPVTSGVRVAAIGEAIEGAVVYFDVPDANQADAYAVRIIEAANTRNEPRRELSGYTLAVTTK